MLPHYPPDTMCLHRYMVLGPNLRRIKDGSGEWRRGGPITEPKPRLSRLVS